MPTDRPEASANHTPVLLIEGDSYARLRHEVALRAAGYHVRAFTNCPGPVDFRYAALVLADPPSFEALRTQPHRRLPPVVVLSDDDRTGVTACLHGAAAWVPAQGQDDYLVDTVDGILHHTHPTPGPG
jgi:hypothetical protein